MVARWLAKFQALKEVFHYKKQAFSTAAGDGFMCQIGYGSIKVGVVVKVLYKNDYHL